MPVYLATPQENTVYCIQKINNHPGLSYAYLTVIEENSKVEKILFYHYPAISSYWEFMETITDIVPLHNSQFHNRLLTFKRGKDCPCGYKMGVGV